MLSKMKPEQSKNHWPIIRFPGSISGKLTLLYSVLTFLLLAGGSIYLFMGLKRNFQTEDNQFLLNKLRVARDIIAHSSNLHERLEEEVVLESQAIQFAKYYTRILDKKGHVIIQSPDFAKLLSSPRFPRPASVQQEPANGKRWKSVNGNTYLLMSAMALNQADKEQPKIIQIALDISYESKLVANYRYRMAFILLLGLIVSAVIGFFVARKGLEPVNQIASKAENITSHQLDERIEREPWPKELVTLARSLDRMLEGLESSFKRLSQFSSDLAHELRTPVNNMLGSAEVALSQKRSAEEYKKVLESNMEECQRISRMVEGLLFLAHADNAQAKPEYARFEAGKVIEELVAVYDAYREEKQIEVIPDGEASIYADALLFRRAVNNVLSNALKYTPEGGNVTIALEKAAHGGAHITIEDTGCGIDQEHLHHIFDRFYRVDPSRSFHSEGSGLGLAIVKSIMELHNGEVTISSEPGKGTRVGLYFPEDGAESG